MREKPKDDTRLRHMLEAINNVIEFTTDVTFEEYSRNKILRFAVIKNLEIVGEAAYLITKEFREEHQEIAWNEVIGMRWCMDIIRFGMRLCGEPFKQIYFRLRIR